MTGAEMSSMERVLTAMGHKEPDRVPFFLMATLHGAKELGISLQEYFSKPEHVAKGQLALRKKYRHDCLYGFFYAAAEAEAWGGEVIYRDDGPPNSGRPFIRNLEDIRSLEPPEIADTPCLQKVLLAIRMLRESSRDEVPIVAAAVSPFSVPVMQLGFGRYIELLYGNGDLFWDLMKVNKRFCADWANAQLEAGATAIGYFDPVSSPTIIPHELYKQTGFIVAKETIAQIKGPCATGFASARSRELVEEVVATGSVGISANTYEDLREFKAACRGRLTIMGNLNTVEMRRWSKEETERIVKEVLAAGAPGGGFILNDNHGEIPYQVPDSVLHAISDTVHRWGTYPLTWA